MSAERLIRPGQARFTRRKLLMGLGVGVAAAPLAACSFDTGSPTALNILDKTRDFEERLFREYQRTLRYVWTSESAQTFSRSDTTTAHGGSGVLARYPCAILMEIVNRVFRAASVHSGKHTIFEAH